VEAEQTNIEEIVTIIGATLRILVTMYACILRNKMANLSGTDK